jgi:hypothetical protein
MLELKLQLFHSPRGCYYPGPVRLLARFDLLSSCSLHLLQPQASRDKSCSKPYTRRPSRQSNFTMKGAILSSIISASTVAAQLTFAPELFQAAAVNINDPEYTTCSAVAQYVGECVTSLGGTDALATADPTEVLNCACCVSATPVYPLYSACSSYLSDEGGATYSDSYSGE